MGRRVCWCNIRRTLATPSPTAADSRLRCPQAGSRCASCPAEVTRSSFRVGIVLAVDVATGDRRIVSGHDPSAFSQDGPPEEWRYVGDRPRFGSVLDVQRAPDGSRLACKRFQVPTDRRVFLAKTVP